MKKLSFLLVIASLMIVASCGNNQGKKKAAETKAVSVQEQYLNADLKIKLDSLVASLQRIQMIPVFEDVQGGKIQLTDKEKKVKPTYLLPVSKAKDVVTLSQKYRAVMMYRIDMAIAELYGMPTEDYKQTIAKLVVDINNPVFTQDMNEKIKEGVNISETINDFYKTELEKGTVNLFWDAAVSSIVEQVYILTKNLDKFIVCFDDQAAADVTYRFILVHDAIESIIEFHPEMEKLNIALKPLYVINAINVQQLRDQLFELKGEIEVVRNSLLD